MHDWLGNSLLPKLQKIHFGPQIALEAVIGPHTPRLLVVLGFSSFEDIWSTHEKLGADKELAASFQKLAFLLASGVLSSRLLVLVMSNKNLHGFLYGSGPVSGGLAAPRLRG